MGHCSVNIVSIKQCRRSKNGAMRLLGISLCVFRNIMENDKNTLQYHVNNNCCKKYSKWVHTLSFISSSFILQSNLFYVHKRDKTQYRQKKGIPKHANDTATLITSVRLRYRHYVAVIMWPVKTLAHTLRLPPLVQPHFCETLLHQNRRLLHIHISTWNTPLTRLLRLNGIYSMVIFTIYIATYL